MNVFTDTGRFLFDSYQSHFSLPSKPLSVQNEHPTRKSAVGSASFSEMWARDLPVSPYQR